MFFLLYIGILMTAFLAIFQRFPKILQDLHCQTLSENFRRFLRISEDCQTYEEFRSYTNEFNYNLRYKLDISEIIDIFTSEDMENMPPESWMWFRMNFTSGVFSSKTVVSI